MNKNQKWLTQTTIACAGVFACAANAADQTQIVTGYNNKCQYLDKDCTGSQTSVTLTSRTGNSETEYALTRFSESDGHEFFDKILRLGNVASLRGVSGWDRQGSGTKVHVKKKFPVTENSRATAGLYFGRLEASIGLNSRIDLATREIKLGKFIIPPYSDIVARDRQDAYGSSLYGGLTLDSGISHRINPHVKVIAGQTATAGLEGSWASVNAGVIISRHAYDKAQVPTGDVAGSPVFPTANGFNIVANVNVRRDIQNRLFDAEQRKADKLGRKATGRLRDWGDIIYEAIKYPVATPTYTGDWILHKMGVESPYKVQPSLQIGMAGRANTFIYSIMAEKPFGQSNDKSVSVYATFGITN